MERSPIRRPDVSWVEVDGDVVAMTSESHIHVLRGAVAALWQVLDGEPLAGLDDLVAETLGIDAERAGEDIEASLAILDRLGLVADRSE